MKRRAPALGAKSHQTKGGEGNAKADNPPATVKGGAVTAGGPKLTSRKMNQLSRTKTRG
ncbi:hypothetical protein UFOVP411_13 [uncultured Caudovirales phage]|uniref:Uncharacterized protein n=1 Tax=uncultured Caudovirales phage TaxID=2100421 RepID=A0A6J5M2N6_9CAUD|nr:hypothetical protein UFOVP411_13 [uncultured Caudovirales phage]